MRLSVDRDDCVQAVHAKNSLGWGQVPEDLGQRLVEEAIEPMKTEATAFLAAKPQVAEIRVPAPKDARATPSSTATQQEFFWVNTATAVKGQETPPPRPKVRPKLRRRWSRAGNSEAGATASLRCCPHDPQEAPVQRLLSS